MQPMGREKVKFPGKSSAWIGKGYRWWWEAVSQPSKKRERQRAKKEIRNERTEYDS